MAETNVLPSMFSELHKAIHVSDYKQALKISNKIIHTKEGNKDEKAMHCKVVSMVYLNQFEEALKFMQSRPEINGLLVFEKAYCQYRLLQTDEALDTLNEATKLDVRLMELKAQVLYKLGFYDESLELYKKLIKECSDDYEDERKANLLAVTASMSLWNQQQVDIELPLRSYEQLYNKACQLLGNGEAVEGEKLLRQAIETCEEFYEEDPDAEEEEVEAELSVIKVQLGYALQLQGQEDAAMKLYNQVIRSRPADVGIAAVTSNNIITINREQNVFDSKKKLKATTAPGIQQKLVATQRSMMETNRALLYMHSGQWEACRKLLKSLQRDQKESDVPCLIQASQLCREKNFDKAIAFLEDFIENHSDPDVHSINLTSIKLTLVQLLFGQGQIERACAVLEGMDDIHHKPAVVSLLVALYDQKKGGEQRAIKVFNEAVDWHKKHKSSDRILLKLLWENAQYKIKHGRPKQAAETLEAMKQLDPKNVKVLAQLIFAYSQFNPSKAHQLSDDLPSLEEMAVSVDADYLEKNAVQLLAPKYVKRQAKQQQKQLDNKNQGKQLAAGDDTAAGKKQTKKEVVSEAKTDQIIKTEKKKKKKKKRLPQNFDPSIEPDPERWLPLRERSYYKGRRKDRKKGVGTGTQGAAAIAGAENLDMSKSNVSGGSVPTSPKPGSVKATTNQVTSPKPSSGARPKGKQTAKGRKKKGKGGW